MTRQSHFSGISGSTLKLIAVFSMLVDHTGATVLRTLCHLPSITAVPGRQAFFVSAYNLSRSIGRIAFPIFCFLLVEGFLHTRSAAKYAFRMLLFAVSPRFHLISHLRVHGIILKNKMSMSLF